MGYFKGLTHGLMLGAAIGVAVAPRPGRETRTDLARRAVKARETSEQIYESAREVWAAARPAVVTAAQLATDLARAMQPVAQGAGGKFIELVGRGQRSQADLSDPSTIHYRSSGTESD